jgi:hypothetical protein
MVLMERDSSYIIEFVHVGNAVKVSACDPVSMQEVSILGSPALPRALLERNAVRKLEHVLSKGASR